MSRSSIRQRIAAALVVVALPATVLGVTPPLAGPSAAGAPRVSVAPDAVTAVLAAHRQGTPVEVASERTETRTVYANPDGTHTADIAAVPVRVKRGNEWKPVDTTLVPAAYGTVRPAAAVGDVAFSAGGLEAPLVRFSHDSAAVELYWPGALPKPLLAGSQATYPEVLPGVDLVMIAERNGYQQHLVVKNREAAKNPALARIALRVATPGLTMAADRDGALRTTDAAGKPVFTAAPSVMWDATGSERTAPVLATVDSGTLTLVPDQGFLADPGTVYPVTIDPQEQGPGVNGWSNPQAGIPADAFWNRSADPSHPGWTQVGQCYNARSDCGKVREAWAYYRFDTGFVANAYVMWANLNTEVVHSPDTSHVANHVLVLTDDVGSGTTWNARPGDIRQIDDRPVPAPGTGSAAMGFEVNDNVNHWGTTILSIRAENGGDQWAWRKYDPGQTHLVVHYNNTPDTPGDLTTDPPAKTCKWCGGVGWIGDDHVRLIASLSDPDNDLVYPMWRWSDGVERDFDGPAQISGAVHDTTIDVSGSDGKLISWWVHANDSAGGISDPASAAFMVDRTAPNAAPGVDARTYKPDNAWHGGATVPDLFTFTAGGVADIDHYAYGWTQDPSTLVNADALGGKATVTLTPPGDGPRTLFVRSFDRAGHPSPTTQYRFYVRAGSGAYALYSFEGNTKDTAFLGNRDGTVFGNPSYVRGAVGTALQFDGQPGSYVSAPAPVRTDASYSYSVWVRPDELPQRPMAILAQTTTQSPKFSGPMLHYRNDPGDPKGAKWTVWLPGPDPAHGQSVGVDAPQAPQLGKWTHLAVVYDEVANELRLYVNGVPTKVAVPNTAPPWLMNTTGQLEIGRLSWNDDIGSAWHGAIDEVQAYDRALSDADVKAMVAKDNVQVGYWKFDDRDGSTAVNSVDGGEAAVLTGGAGLIDAGAVGRAVHFDGVDGQAATSAPAVRTDQSFSVSAWVKADRLTPGGSSMTAVSQDGVQNSGFYLQYNGPTNKWVFLKFSTDDNTPTAIIAQASQQPQPNQWVHLTGVYDAAAKTMSIYVNGALGGSATLPAASWSATGPLVIGRAKYTGVLVDRWAGSVDEVRLYSRVLDPTEIRGIMSQNNVTAGTWKFDGDATDSSSTPHNGAVVGKPTWLAGQTSVPDPNDLAIHFDGTASQYVHAPKVLDVTQSFAVSAWVKPDKPGTGATVVSQDAQHVGGFDLSAAADGQWHFFMPSVDAAGTPQGNWANGGSVQYGVWAHITAVYSRERQRMELYLNGTLIASQPRTAVVAAGGELQIGRYRQNDAYTDYLGGAIDDLRVYSRPLFAEEIATQAGRDLSLVHSWQLDEGSGSVSADSIGSRAITLAGAGHVPGKLGNALQFNGTSSYAATSGVDLRTDQSFTVSAWVYTDPTTCTQTLCNFDAVSVDGGQTSKFRLGRFQDGDQAFKGKWKFEMPKSNGTIMSAAVSVTSADIGHWVNLVGVYDAPAKKIWLYVNGVRIDDGTLDEQWQANGGLQLGRGKNAGAWGEFWKGGVDEVRLYTGALDADRINALYNSYATAVNVPATLPVADTGQWKFDDATGATASDSSGKNHPIALTSGASWSSGRTTAGATLLNGTTGYGEAAGPVLDTTQSFSVSAWVSVALNPPAGNRTVLAQDGAAQSVFSVQFNQASGRWAVLVPTSDANNATNPVLITSSDAAYQGLWLNLAAVYDAVTHQVRLYVNGKLAGVQTGVTVLPSSGKFAIGRGRVNSANAEFFAGNVDDVRAFGRALSDGEIRKVHDDISPVQHGNWTFEGVPDDLSWRHNPTTLSGGPSYVAGVHGQAIQFNGTSGAATAQLPGIPGQDSFTVSAWAKLSSTDHDATVLAQDGDRTSQFVLQYNKNIGRWIFGTVSQDADGAQLVYAYSPQAPAVGTWTHLTGLYDYATSQLRLYVNGELVNVRDNAVVPYAVQSSFTIGRSLSKDAPAAFFPGAIDDVQTDLGVVPDADLRQRAGGTP